MNYQTSVQNAVFVNTVKSKSNGRRYTVQLNARNRFFRGNSPSSVSFLKNISYNFGIDFSSLQWFLIKVYVTRITKIRNSFFPWFYQSVILLNFPKCLKTDSKLWKLSKFCWIEIILPISILTLFRKCFIHT